MPTPVTIDETAGCARPHSYTYTRVVDLAGRRVRARIRRDYYAFQSHAVAEVLSDALTWTHLTQVEADDWHGATAEPHARSLDARAELAPLADRLIERAVAILP
ncbi:hypothetical protein FZ103_10640 [Streptomonospora sp. PA3]|uniref:hypothetical protein n=1 Tax=Streptomonospora sp. PA3 TaxID=2607326 RepID=UPI0012DDEA1D|nr:hypothetical protein [Streptomonospora sp. PA3]MUL41628.1 hypothetical protein [Streptomonospora sp. PA3]